MLAFDHENLPKTRRSILIVCVLVIALERYLTASTSNIGFGGLNIEITKPQIIDGLSIGLLYLWTVFIAQLAVGPFSDWIKRREKLKEGGLREEYNSYGSSDEEPRQNEAIIIEIACEELRNETRRYEGAIQWYSMTIFMIPPLLLSAFVWIKYDGFCRSFSAILAVLL